MTSVFASIFSTTVGDIFTCQFILMAEPASNLPMMDTEIKFFFTCQSWGSAELAFDFPPWLEKFSHVSPHKLLNLSLIYPPWFLKVALITPLIWLNLLLICPLRFEKFSLVRNCTSFSTKVGIYKSFPL